MDAESFARYLRDRKRQLEEREIRRSLHAQPVTCEPCRRDEHLDCVRPCSCRVRVRAAS